MRRFAASLLLMLLCTGLALPLLQAQTSGVPACCRRNGKHHCEVPSQGNGFRTQAASCPYKGATAFNSRSTPLTSPAPALIVCVSRESAVILESPDVAPPIDGNAQKRGPPLS